VATDKSAVPVPGQARSGGGNSGADARQGGSDGRSAAREFRHGDQISVAAKVSIVAEQAAPAPVAPTLSGNGAALVNAIGAEPGWRAAAHLSSALPGDGQNNAQPMRELKIQLHPLELGVVTAHLRTVGEKLSVELKVDNHHAYDRLSADSDAIIKSLRSLGFDIDSVSIQQPQAAATAVARSDASAGTGSFSRDTPSFQPGNSGSGGERFGGQTSGRGERGGTQGNDAAQPLNQNRTGSSLYI
jgi:chemotaxis protein MotD